MHYTRSLLFTAIVNGRAFQTVDLTAVPGVSSLTAHTLLTEVGPDLRRFPNAAALPGNHMKKAHLPLWKNVRDNDSSYA